MSSSLSAELKAVVSSLVGGARYGTKIRFPHALVMTALFRSKNQPMSTSLQRVLRLTFQHATNLAAFAASYKLILLLLKVGSSRIRANSRIPYLPTIVFDSALPLLGAKGMLESSQPGFPHHPYHSFLAGAVGGYLIWGRYSSINYQILLYLSSRVLLGLWKHANKGSTIATATMDRGSSYRVCAALIWGTVMYLFEESPDVLHPSLKNSMNEIYRYDQRQTTR